MAREALVKLCVGLSFGLGCGLLTPYPGGGDPAKALAGSTAPDSNSPFDTGMDQGPLVDPVYDDSISVTSNNDPTLALPGSAFSIDLNFTAKKMNVVGGGIQFPGSSKIQWTFIEGLEGSSGGQMQFGYVVDAAICDGLSNLCHEIQTKQFAVARNLAPNKDADGDGTPDGDYVVSPPADVTVVLQCATCESKSCQEVLPAGSCAACAQADVCVELYDLCYAPGQPKEGTDEADSFDAFLGPDGLAWSTDVGCESGKQTCQEILDRSQPDCITEQGTGTSGGSGTN